MSIDWSGQFASRMDSITASEIRELLKLLDQPDIISFAGGIPDPDLFPSEAIAAAYERALKSNALAGSVLQYAPTEGFPPLRAWIGERIGAGADDILITSGSQQALDLIGKLLIGTGEAVAVTMPTYLGALQAFSAYEPRYVGVAMDEDGVVPESLEAALAQKPKLFYLVPDFLNPTGVSLTLERRRQVIALCRAAGVPIVEDAAYVELRYDGERLPTLLALDREMGGGTVLHAGTFSKTLAPALRIGWVSAPVAALQKLILLKQATDLHASTINQVVAHNVASEIYDRQIGRILPAYRTRRDAMLKALEAHFPKGCRWTRPGGGMFVWAELPERIDGARLLARAIREARVAFVPGAAFFPDRSGRNTIRLSFSTSKPERIETGIQRLAETIDRELAEAAPA